MYKAIYICTPHVLSIADSRTPSFGKQKLNLVKLYACKIWNALSQLAHTLVLLARELLATIIG